MQYNIRMRKGRPAYTTQNMVQPCIIRQYIHSKTAGNHVLFFKCCLIDRIRCLNDQMQHCRLINRGAAADTDNFTRNEHKKVPENSLLITDVLYTDVQKAFAIAGVLLYVYLYGFNLFLHSLDFVATLHFIIETFPIMIPILTQQMFEGQLFWPQPSSGKSLKSQSQH